MQSSGKYYLAMFSYLAHEYETITTAISLTVSDYNINLRPGRELCLEE